MTLDELAEEIPQMAEGLGKLLIRDALGVMRDMNVTLTEMSPAVSITYEPKDGSDRLKVTLSVTIDDETDESDEDDFDGDDQ